jgi:peptidoglycan/xylan/chitin deacetylase (PgdA/CDA1 family)
MADMHQHPAGTTSSSRLRRRAFTAFAVSLTLAAAGVTVLPSVHPVRASSLASGLKDTARPAPSSGPGPARRTAAHEHAGGRSRRMRDGRADRGPAPNGHGPLDRLVRLGEPIYCGGDTEALVALTFDDGPGILSPVALQQLERRDVPATFFLVGKLIGEPEFAGVVRREARLGVVGDHTWDHTNMTNGSPREYRDQIARTRTAAARASGQRVRLFRPPFGSHDAALDRWVRAHDMLEIVWSIDTGDSQGATADRIYRTVKADLSAGDIVLLHDNRGTTEKALPRILDLMRDRGLTPVTVPELLTQDPPSTEQLRHHTCP